MSKPIKKLPPDETICCSYYDSEHDNKPSFIITKRVGKLPYAIYDVSGDSIVRLGRGDSPIFLERTYVP